jgi:hypothetical protein
MLNTYIILFTVGDIVPSLRSRAFRVIMNAECEQHFGPQVVIDSTICTSSDDYDGPNVLGPCPVSNVQCLKYRRISFTNFQHLLHKTGLVVRWSQFVTIDCEVLGSIRGSTVRIFP